MDTPRRRGLPLVWAARLLVQIAGNVLFTYLLFYFESIDPTRAPIEVAGRVGHATGIALLISIPVGIAVGRLSDHVGRRKPFLLASAILAAAGLLIMAKTAAGAGGWSIAVTGYGLFSCGLAVFLGLHSALAMQLLPSPTHRGRDLGVLNLTNTLPALVGPALAWTLTDQSGFGHTFVALAALTTIGGLLILGADESDRIATGSPA